MSIETILIAGWILIGISALLLVWCLLGERRRSRTRRCPRCWYDMASVPGLKCPECGHEARSEARLFQRRRRWRLAIVAILLIAIGIGGASAHRLERVNWLAWTPNSVLLALVKDPAPPRPNDTRTKRDQLIAAEIWRRYGEGGLPLSTRRKLTAAEMAAPVAPITITTRAKWPVGVPILVSVAIADPATSPLPRDFYITSITPAAAPLRLYDRGWIDGGRYTYKPDPIPEVFSLGAVSSPMTSATFMVQIAEGPAQVWGGTMTVPLVVSGTVEETIASIRNEPYMVTLREWATACLRLSPDATETWIMGQTPPGIPNGGTLGLVIAFEADGVEVARSELVWTTSKEKRIYDFSIDPDAPPTIVISRPILGDLQRLRDALTSGAPWTVRVAGDPLVALRDFDATRYWSGKFFLPLELMKKGPVVLRPNPEDR